MTGSAHGGAIGRGGRLEIVPLGASEPEVDLAECFHGEGGECALLETPRERRLVRARNEQRGAVRRWALARYSVDGERVIGALDHTLFEADAERFAETALYRARTGPNLHRAPIVLPRRIALDTWYHPVAGQPGRVRLAYAGPVELRLGAVVAVVHAARLLAEEHGVARAQWLGRGLGELALGPDGAPFERWLIAHRSDGGAVTLGDVAESLRRGPWPELPDDGPRDPRSSLS